MIGGTASDNSSYGGLQRFFFANSTWETLSPPANVLKSRTSHSAAYLNSSQEILVYAGSQPNAPSFLSSQTFLLQTQPPYNLQSFTSRGAPPGNLPIVEPWNSSHAIMVGGSNLNTQVWTFGASDGWREYGTNLTSAIEGTARGTVVDGSDGSKVLNVYDFSVSPNVIDQIVLQDADGQPAATGQTIGNSSNTRKRKRDLTLSNWPKYNSTDAPTATRSDCAVAQGANGLAVIAAGSSSTPIALFNENDNSWVDTSSFFGRSRDSQTPLQPSSTTGSSPSSTSTSTAGSGAGSQNGEAHRRSMRTLGICLGVLLGIAALLILILLFFRWRKQKRKRQEGYVDEKSDKRLSFQDRGASFMKEAGGSATHLPLPPNDRYRSTSPGSHSSLAIIAGKFGNGRRGSNHAPKASYESTQRLVGDPRDRSRNRSGVSSPVEMRSIREGTAPLPGTDKAVPGIAFLAPHLYSDDKEVVGNSDQNRKRSSGWSKYFATSGPTGPNGISHIPAAYVKGSAPGGAVGRKSGATDRTSDGASVYSTNSKVGSHPSRIPSSAMVPPLDLDFINRTMGDSGKSRLSHVAIGSPAFSHSREDLRSRGSTVGVEGQRGLIVDPGKEGQWDRQSQISGHSLSSFNRSTMSSDYYVDSGATPWTPTSSNQKGYGDLRAPSSTYTDSVAGAVEGGLRVPSRGKGSGFFPGAGTSYKPSPSRKTHAKMGSNAAPSAEWASPAPVAGLSLPSKDVDRGSTMTVFPRGVPSAYYAGRENVAAQPPVAEPAVTRKKSQRGMVSDMSWLNLGLGGGSNRI